MKNKNLENTNESISLSILLHDDDENFLKSMKSEIGHMGFNCFTALSRLEVKNILETNRIDIFICDFLLIGYTGLDIIKEVKQFNPEINTILLTGYSSNMPEEVALLNNDIDAYATKDSKLDYLFKTIKFIAKFIAKNRNKNIDYLLYNLTFEERLKKLRKIKGVTQEELSNFLGVGKSSVVGYENGSIRPSFNQLINIIKFYGIDPNTLFGSLEQYNK